MLKLRQNLEDKIAENQALEYSVKDLRQKLLLKKEQMADMQLTVDKLQKTLEIILSGEEVQVYFLN